MAHTHYFEVNNVRTKHSASPVGTDGARAQLSTTHSTYFQGSSFSAAQATVVTNALAHAMKLYDPTAIAALNAVITTLGTTAGSLAEDTAPWQQRVGKGVWQITAGYSSGVNAAALTSAIAGQVDQDLE